MILLFSVLSQPCLVEEGVDVAQSDVEASYTKCILLTTPSLHCCDSPSCPWYASCCGHLDEHTLLTRKVWSGLDVVPGDEWYPTPHTFHSPRLPCLVLPGQVAPSMLHAVVHLGNTQSYKGRCGVNSLCALVVIISYTTVSPLTSPHLHSTML